MLIEFKNESGHHIVMNLPESQTWAITTTKDKKAGEVLLPSGKVIALSYSEANRLQKKIPTGNKRSSLGLVPMTRGAE